MEKQKKAAEDETPKEEEEVEKDTTEKKKKSKKKASFQLIPERKKYEMLCRGEGSRMVRQTVRHAKTPFLKLQNIPPFQLRNLALLFSQTDPPQAEPAVLPIL